jgi:hypothetical protein
MSKDQVPTDQARDIPSQVLTTLGVKAAFDLPLPASRPLDANAI